MSWFLVVSDVTNGMGQLNIQGPRSRELMQSLTDTDLSSEAFPFRCAKEISLGFAKLLLIDQADYNTQHIFFDDNADP